MDRAGELARAAVEECRRRIFDDDLPRLRKCLEALTDEEIWARPNANTVSVGNLVLHLAGNVRQWVCAGLGGAPDVRERSKEFSERGPVPRAELLRRLESSLADAAAVMARAGVEELLRRRPVQAFEETGIGILVHVAEHFSYHTGQIVYAVKSRKDVDLAFYRGVDLERKQGPVRG
jgi:uncharacterized damage-inducible protein DinB